MQICKQCGLCCQAIQLRYIKSMKRLKEIERTGNKDVKFIRKNWKRISYKEACKINPKLKMSQKGLFFKCRKYKNNSCLVHNTRPDICRDFPFYDGNTNNNFISAFTYSPKCGYVNYAIDIEARKRNIIHLIGIKCPKCKNEEIHCIYIDNSFSVNIFCKNCGHVSKYRYKNIQQAMEYKLV